MLFLYTQGEKDSVKEDMCNIQSLWDTVEAFEESPGVHKVNRLLSDPSQVKYIYNILAKEIKKSEEDEGCVADQWGGNALIQKFKDKGE
jgi:hypothetical protein